MKRPDGVRPPSGARPPVARPERAGDGDHATEPITLTTPLTLRVTPEPRSIAGKQQAERLRAEKAQAEKAEKTQAEKAQPTKAQPAKTPPLKTPAAKSPPSPAEKPRLRLPRVALPGAERRSVARAGRERRRFERGEVRRFTKRARRRRTIALVTAGSLALLALVVAVAAYSPLMAVKTIEISGTQRVSAQAIQDSLDDQVGVPLTLVDRAAIGRVLGSYPLVRSYSVQTRPPSTLVVSVVERTPVAVIADGAEFDLVDPAGVVIETAPAAQEGYPLLSTPTGSASGAAFRATARVLLTLPDTLEGQVASAAATTGDDVSLTLTNGSVVLWGGSEDSALKAVVLDKLMAATDPATVASYDVSSPQAAVVARR
ncbi:FtsQ-type POTRA domain-containing protein [Rathayibacter sp. VKM Ac-2760]|uniref:FtsQ-type POTRA domain-containing protein n=1 Tax=Rathayibacter sp. VKM Ac-2760 TaxID=2609253 RepID=UPI0013160208|nr:FtsQ-type POTRA domain-containing protein [Rathayibacter sp. VKM Ac-2760]QHC58415.1 FtsQ-type POTRA domain-containing protein [Rathayibacter sp. VKM Ac-2760]